MRVRVLEGLRQCEHRGSGRLFAWLSLGGPRHQRDHNTAEHDVTKIHQQSGAYRSSIMYSDNDSRA